MPLREFSEFEKKVIQEKLLTTGGGLSSLFEEDFNKEVRIIVHYFESGSRKFEFRSEKYTGDQIYNVLVDLIELLSFLLENNYLYRHFLPTTNLNDFNVEKQISLGDFNGSKSLNFLASDDQNFISDFILKNENSIFKATEPLRALAGRGFLSQEEIHHNQIIQQARAANSTVKYLGIGTILVGLGSFVSTCTDGKNLYSDLYEKFGQFEQRINTIVDGDSSRYNSLRKEDIRLKRQLDSLARCKPKMKKGRK